MTRRRINKQSGIGSTRKSSKERPSSLTTKRTSKRIPPPPHSDTPWEKQAEYFEKYGMVDLEQAGYSLPLNVADKTFLTELRTSAKRHLAKSKREQLNLSLQPSQFIRLQEAAKRRHLLPTTLARAWLLEKLDQDIRRK